MPVYSAAMTCTAWGWVICRMPGLCDQPAQIRPTESPPGAHELEPRGFGSSFRSGYSASCMDAAVTEMPCPASRDNCRGGKAGTDQTYVPLRLPGIVRCPGLHRDAACEMGLSAEMDREWDDFGRFRRGSESCIWADHAAGWSLAPYLEVAGQSNHPSSELLRTWGVWADSTNGPARRKHVLDPWTVAVHVWICGHRGPGLLLVTNPLQIRWVHTQTQVPYTHTHVYAHAHAHAHVHTHLASACQAFLGRAYVGPGSGSLRRVGMLRVKRK